MTAINNVKMAFSVSLTIVLFICTSRSQAQSQALQVVTLEYPPYVMHKEGHPEGLAVILFTRLLERLQQPAQLHVLPFKRALRRVQSGRADAIFPILKTSSRQRSLTYMQLPIIEERVVLFARHDDKTRYNDDLRFLQRKQVCVQRAFSVGSRVDQLFAKRWMTRVNVDNQRDCVRLLKLGKVHYYLSDHFAGEQAIRDDRAAHLVRRFSHTIQLTPAYLAWNSERASSTMLADADELLLEMFQNGEYRQIVDDFRREFLPGSAEPDVAQE